MIGFTELEITELIQHLQSIFQVKDLSSLSYFLDVEADRQPQGLHLCQTRYICDLLNLTHMAGAKPLTTPIMASTKLFSTEGALIYNPSSYRQIIGALQ